ncbi:MAG: hypothetical protein M0Q38_02930 [Bacteroidales bacterium]|jgi:hypothetical protein|nr:hypothetical protein [Bacteroidales bacterium]
MKTTYFWLIGFIFITMLINTGIGHSQSLSSTLKEETVNYSADGASLRVFVTFDDSIKGKRPVIIIVHEKNSICPLNTTQRLIKVHGMK